MKSLNNSHSGFFESVRKGREIVVIKIGTNSLINSTNGTLALATLAKVCELIKNLKEEGEFDFEVELKNSQDLSLRWCLVEQSALDVRLYNWRSVHQRSHRNRRAPPSANCG